MKWIGKDGNRQGNKSKLLQIVSKNERRAGTREVTNSRNRGSKTDRNW